MRRKIRGASAFTTFALVVMVSQALRAHAQDSKTAYPSMASHICKGKGAIRT